MGFTSDTNIKLLTYYPEDKQEDILGKTITQNPLTIVDNDSYNNGIIEIFDGLYVKPDEMAPKLVCICKRGEMGGGADLTQEILQKVTETLLNPASNLYLPTIVINGFLTKLTVDGSIAALKMIFNKFKLVYRRKRIKVMYYNEEVISCFEFPSETVEAEFEKGIKDIPDAVERSIKAKYFTRSLKKEIWIEEDADNI